jgi:S-adenosyl-L-methionine hydrolase (adenosine-forming)
MPRYGYITLLTDFGARDAYVGAVKGAILSVNPEADIMDVSHEIPPHDIREAAFTLLGYSRFYPFRTTHMVIVDPGVGTARKDLLVVTENYYYLAPDNGVLSFVLERERIEAIVSLEETHFFRSEEGRTSVCPTFHARDVFAPVAGWLSKGSKSPDDYGPRLDNCVRFEIPKPRALGDKLLKGQVLHVDRFGNAITNVTRAQFDEMTARLKTSPKIVASGKEITELAPAYGAAKSPLFFLFGGHDFLEIAAREQSAAAALGLAPGKDVGVVWG